MTSDFDMRVDIDRDDLVEGDHAELEQAVLENGRAVTIERLEAVDAVGTPDPGGHHVAGKERRREAHRDPSHPTRIVDLCRLENRSRGERHRAEAVDDPSGQADRPRELVVEVNREVVSGRCRVTIRLVLRDPIADLAERIGTFLVQSMVRSALADALVGHDASEELGDVLLVHRRPVLRPRLDVDHE